MIKSADRGRCHAYVRTHHEARVTGLRLVVGRTERRDAGAEGDDQPDHDHGSGGRPGATANAAGQQAAKRSAEAVAERQREVGEHTLDDPAQHQDPAEPDPDRDDHQMQLQFDGAAEVHRAADALEAAMATLVPLNGQCGAQDQEIDSEQPPERSSGCQLRSFVADLTGDGASA